MSDRKNDFMFECPSCGEVYDVRDRISHARPISEWHEDMGDKLWWRFPLAEAPYVGSPMDLGKTVEVVTRYIGKSEDGETCPVVERLTRYQVGGWPGYHTHFTDIPTPIQPEEVPA